MYEQEYLYHHGIKGQKWGVRRYQDLRGKLTPAGEKRYQSATTRVLKGYDSKAYKKSKELDEKLDKKWRNESAGKSAAKNILMTQGQRTTYDMARSVGKSRGEAAVRAYLDINLNTMASSLGGAVLGNRVARLNNSAGKLVNAQANYGIGKTITQTGHELSLQQRHLRKKYINK